MNTPLRFLAALGLASLLFAAGCSSKPNGSVTGTVTLKGKQLTTGIVRFYKTDGSQGGQATILPNGTYDAGQLPSGDYVAVVKTGPDLQPPPGMPGSGGPVIPGKAGAGTAAPGKMPPGTKEMPGAGDKSVDIPKQYTDRATSPLKVTVSGRQTFNIEM